MNARVDTGVELKPRAKNGSRPSAAADNFPVAAKARNGDSWIPSSADVKDLCRALADRQRQLDVALKKIGKLDHDVAELTQAVAQERQHAYYDALTSLPNRRLLMDRFNQAVARAARQHKQMALLFLDLNGFKRINDTLGHDIGDALLKQVALRLVSCIRTSDTVCRYGGDEFVILLAEIASHESAFAAAAKIRARVAKPYELAAQTVQLTTSIGMAVYPNDGVGYADLIGRSDNAMYFDKTHCPEPRARTVRPICPVPAF
jgi:diguanylate cyclase (GGDEF)-like protein